MSVMETRKELEYRLLEEVLEKTREPLANILLYAAAYLEKDARPGDTKRAEMLNKYSDLMAARIMESRDTNTKGEK